MFSGLSAFPLTPMNETRIDEAAFTGLIERLTTAGVDSIGALGSTGSYAYLTREERARVAKIAVEHAGNTPVIVGIGALRTKDVLNLADDAQKAGASGLLLAPMSYQKLSDAEVLAHFKAVAEAISVPLCVYDNPGTTHFHFSDELHGQIAELPHIASIKIPGVPSAPEEAKARVERLRADSKPCIHRRQWRCLCSNGPECGLRCVVFRHGRPVSQHRAGTNPRCAIWKSCPGATALPPFAGFVGDVWPSQWQPAQHRGRCRAVKFGRHALPAIAAHVGSRRGSHATGNTD